MLRGYFGVLFLSLLFYTSIIKADDIWFSGILVENVKLLKIEPETIMFSLPNGTELVKSQKEITRIERTGLTDFNEAEKQLSLGHREKALDKYKAALSSVQDGQDKFLIQERMKLAQQNLSTVVSTPATIPAKCSHCLNLNKIACKDCQGRGTGKCANCSNGYNLCKECNGKGNSVCSKCNGTRKTIYHRYPNDEWRTCYKCKGKGKIDCEKCSGSSFTGRVACSDCNGTGRKGVCSTCEGKKKVQCPHCSEKMVVPLEDNKPSPTVVAINANDPLASPESLYKTLAATHEHPSNRPDWNDMTSLQKQKALKEYEQEVAKHANKSDFDGKQVTWVLWLDDVAADQQNQSQLKLTALSSEGCFVTSYVSSADEDFLMSLKKKTKIIVSGTISECKINDVFFPANRHKKNSGKMTVELTNIKVSQSSITE